MRFVKTLSVMLALVAAVFLGMSLDHLLDRGEGPATAEALTAPPEIPVTPAGGLVDFTNVVETVQPAVVAVTATEVVNPHAGMGDVSPFDFFLNPDRRSPRDEDGDDPGSFRSQSGGSGFIISSDGHILTNHHVVENAESLEVRFADGSEYEAKVVGSDQETDIALIKIDAKNLPYLPLGESETTKVGEWVMAMGNPINYEWSVTVGVISGKGRRLAGSQGSSLDNYLQTDAAINFGNSGGPLINARGEVIGINTLIIRNSARGPVEGIGFAVPIDMAKDAIPQFKESGRIARGYVGLSLREISDEQRAYYKQNKKIDLDGGAFVAQVVEDGPGAEAGIEKGDIILSIDGQPVNDSGDAVRKVSGHKPGERMTVALLRGTKEKKVKVTLGDRAQGLGFSSSGNGTAPAEPKVKPSSLKKLGMTLKPITPVRSKRMGFDGETGLLITQVDPRSSAGEQGLVPNLLVTEINEEKVSGLSHAEEILAEVKPGDVVQLYVLLPGDGDEVTGQYVWVTVEK